jgi:hypothetical protein
MSLKNPGVTHLILKRGCGAKAFKKCGCHTRVKIAKNKRYSTVLYSTVVCMAPHRKKVLLSMQDRKTLLIIRFAS